MRVSTKVYEILGLQPVRNNNIVLMTANEVQTMKRRKWLIIFLIVIFSIISVNHYLNKRITSEDVLLGKQIVEEHFNAIQNEDLAAADATLGRYKKGLYNESNIGKWKPELFAIEHVTYDKVHIPPDSYRSNYGKNPYKSMSLLVTLRDQPDANKYQWYYILVQEERGDPWLIHDWGI